MFEGTAVALITPFKNGAVDYKALETLIDFHARAGTDCVLVCGTTGESATLNHVEHKQIVRHCAAYVRSIRGDNRYPLLMAGTGSNSTQEALELTQDAKEAGADLSLQVCPYYNKPTQAGLLRHFKTLAREVDIPQVLYNIQGRTGVNIAIDTTVELSQEKNIIGVKEASGNLDQISEIARLTDEEFYVWSGDDALTLPILAIGGKGVISVSANIVPKDVRAMVRAYLDGDPGAALIKHRSLSALNKAMFIETNPLPVKTAVNLLSEAPDYGVPHCGDFRSPMVPMAPISVDTLKQVMKQYGLPVN